MKLKKGWTDQRVVLHVLWGLLLILVFPRWTLAQHPVDVQRMTAQGHHFEALTTYEKMPKRRITAGAQFAAANTLTREA